MKNLNIGILLAGIGEKAGTDPFDIQMINLFAERKHLKPVFIAENKQIYLYDYKKNKLSYSNANVIEESAKLVERDIQNISDITSVDLDALIIPGGYGILYTYSDYIENKEFATIHPALNRIIKKMHEAQKPIIALGIGIYILSKSLLNASINPIVAYTESNEILNQLPNLGVHTIDSKTSDAILDSKNNLLTTIAGLKGKYFNERFYALETLFEEFGALLPKD